MKNADVADVPARPGGADACIIDSWALTASITEWPRRRIRAGGTRSPPVS